MLAAAALLYKRLWKGRPDVLNHITVSFEGDHILSRVSRACEKHSCFNVLGIAGMSTPIEAVEACELPRIFRED